jgi:hypothetical protein
MIGMEKEPKDEGNSWANWEGATLFILFSVASKNKLLFAITYY